MQKNSAQKELGELLSDYMFLLGKFVATYPSSASRNEYAISVALLKLAESNSNFQEALKKCGVKIQSLFDVIEEENCTALKALLGTEGVDVNAKNAKGLTPVMAAAISGRADLVEILLANGAQPNIQDPNGWTALMYASASAKGFVGGVELLLKKNADANITNTNGDNALMIAIERGSTGVAKLLVQKTSLNLTNTALNLEDRIGVSEYVALMGAIHAERVDVIRPLIRNIDLGLENVRVFSLAYERECYEIQDQVILKVLKQWQARQLVQIALVFHPTGATFTLSKMLCKSAHSLRSWLSRSWSSSNSR